LFLILPALGFLFEFTYNIKGNAKRLSWRFAPRSKNIEKIGQGHQP
jgi:hypothetical protein